MPEGILHNLRHDHEEVVNLIEKIRGSDDRGKRDILFKQLMTKLLAHAHAEQKVLYTKLEKSDDFRSRGFAYKGENEHQIIEHQLQRMMRAPNKASEQFTAQLSVLRDLVTHHVEVEESTGFGQARREFDCSKLESLGQEFLKEKETQLTASSM